MKGNEKNPEITAIERTIRNRNGHSVSSPRFYFEVSPKKESDYDRVSFEKRGTFALMLAALMLVLAACGGKPKRQAQRAERRRMPQLLNRYN
ncbi:hypothetical protein [Paenibacillus sp. 1A_MP2]|uniref:hypothetical protein n=1 Tax=Paenibacillus sp. 1A_MP2 TaxID=3457495 RepID=UPI003FCE02E1